MKFKAFGTGTKNALSQWVARCVIALVIVDFSMLLLGCPPNGLLTDIQDKVTNARTTTYTVTYSGNGNTGGSVPVDGANYQQGQKVTVLGNTGGLTKTGNSFAGWNTKSDGSGTTYAPGQTFAIAGANVTLYAVWSPLYTVTYNANGASGSVPVDHNTYLQGAQVTVLGNIGGPPLVKTGYTFVGWNTQAGGGGTAYVVDATFSMGSSNVMLYAQWTNNPTFTVTYNANGATSGNPPNDPNNYQSGATVTVLGNIGTIPLARTGYAFVGWNANWDGSGTSYSQGSQFAITATMTLYAQWAPTYTVTYNGNGNTGGSVPIDSNVYLQGASVSVMGPASLSRAGWNFAGWSPNANRTPPIYTQGQQFAMGNANVALYAVWTLNGYTVYAATTDGLSVSSNGGLTWINYTTANGLGSNTVYDVYAVSGSSIYAATASGLSTYNGTSWANQTTANGLPSNIIYGVSFAGPWICVATDNGVSIFNGTSWVNDLTGKTAKAFWGSALLRFAATTTGMEIMGMGGWTNYLTSSIVNDYYYVGGTTIAATQTGLYIAANLPTWVGPYLSGRNVMGVYAVDVSNIYVATDSGLWVTSNGGTSGQYYTTANGLGSNSVQGVYVISNLVVAATTGGISISDNQRQFSFISSTMANGLLSNNINRIWVTNP